MSNVEEEMVLAHFIVSDAGQRLASTVLIGTLWRRRESNPRP